MRVLPCCNRLQATRQTRPRQPLVTSKLPMLSEKSTQQGYVMPYVPKIGTSGRKPDHEVLLTGAGGGCNRLGRGKRETSCYQVLRMCTYAVREVDLYHFSTAGAPFLRTHIVTDTHRCCLVKSFFFNCEQPQCESRTFNVQHCMSATIDAPN